MTDAEFDNFDEFEAELWIARRFAQFVEAGFPPDLSLLFAVHPEVELPTPSATAINTAA